MVPTTSGNGHGRWLSVVTTIMQMRWSFGHNFDKTHAMKMYGTVMKSSDYAPFNCDMLLVALIHQNDQ